MAGSGSETALVENFRASKGAKGLERYLKECALRDERGNDSRTYLVKDSLSGELACYFSLRACLAPLSLPDGFFCTIPGVELANFAVNDAYRAKQRTARKTGAYAFRNFILPLARLSSSIVGAKWLCLYALPDERLLRYYSENLGFMRLPAERENFVHSRFKPQYDKGCIFMYQSL